MADSVQILNATTTSTLQMDERLQAGRHIWVHLSVCLMVYSRLFVLHQPLIKGRNQTTELKTFHPVSG